MTPPEDLDLLLDYLDDRLPPEAVAAVEARLREEPALAEALVALGRDEAVMADWARSTRTAEALHDEVEAWEEAEPARPVSPWRRRLAVGSLAALAAAVAGVALLLGRPWESTAPVALAVLEKVQGEVYVLTAAGRSPARPGQALYSGVGISTTGDGSGAAVQYPDATRLELGPDTRIELLGSPRPAGKAGASGAAGKQVFLREGELRGERPEGRRGALVLTTPHAEARVEGSRFSLASAADATFVEMDAGRGTLTRTSDGRSIDVPAGCCAVAAPQVEPFRPRARPPRVSTARITLSDPSGPVVTLARTPDGRTLVTGGWDGAVRTWDAATGQPLRVNRGHRRTVRALAVSADGTIIASGTDEKTGSLRLWDMETGIERPGPIAPWAARGSVSALAFAPDGRTLAIAGLGSRDRREVRLWDVVTGEEGPVLRGHTGEVRELAFAPNGRTLASAAVNDPAIRVWDVATGEVVHRLTGHPRQVGCLAYSPDGELLASGCQGGHVKLWDAATGEESVTLRGDSREVRDVAFSPDGRALAVAEGGLARVWDVATLQEQASFTGLGFAATAVEFSPNGRTLAVAGWNRAVKLFDLSPWPAPPAGR